MREIHVCLATDNNYVPYCGVAILSMFENKDPEDQVRVYILHKDLTAENIKRLEDLSIAGECTVKTVVVCKEQFEHLPLPPDLHFTIETYYRFAIPRLFPRLDKIVYMDCDIVVKGSLWELYNIDMQDAPLAMVRDAGIRSIIYYNAGVMLVNCRSWREEGIEEALHEYAKKNREKIRYVDQDVINGLLGERVLELDEKWNGQIALRRVTNADACKEMIASRDIKIVHYFGTSKPWHDPYQNVLVDEYKGYMEKFQNRMADRR